MDSYQQFAMDFWKNKNLNVFKTVAEDDVDDVMINFAVAVSGFNNTRNFRVFPVEQKEEFDEARAIAKGRVWDSQIKCKSGQIYWVGCHHD